LLRYRYRGVLLVVLVFVSGCSRKPNPSLERLALLRANILIADPASEWMSTAVPLALEQDLLTCKNVMAHVARDESGAYQIGATEVLRTTVENRNGRIRIQGTVTDLATQRNRQVFRIEGSSSGGLLPSVNALATRLNDGATYFSTKNDLALRAFVGAAETSDFRTRIGMLDQAIRVDPSFGLAYLALADTLAQARQDSAPLVAIAASHRSSFTPLDRVRYDLVSARLSHAPLSKQEQAARAILQIAPNDLDALAALGSARFLTGDRTAGQQALNRALELSPGNLNLRQQLAQGLLETRRFADAEKVLLRIDNNPAVLPALATCILLEGDVNRADVVFNRYLALRPPNDRLAPIFRATWLAISGRAAKAIDGLQSANFDDPALRSLAESQIAILQLMVGDSAAAKRSAGLAAQLDKRPLSFGAVTLLITHGGDSAASWRDQVSALGLREQPAQIVLGYGFFLNHHYDEAAGIWQQILLRSGGADLPARAMLSASLERQGRAADARNVLVQPFVPDFNDLYAAVPFNEMRRLLNLQVH
jgi:tetratricopeptide (TPR) repeat protein